MKTKCTLEEFGVRARELHEGSKGIKRTRLLLSLRPKDARKTFVLKATNGSSTISARVDHVGQLAIVERIIGEFMLRCTADS